MVWSGKSAGAARLALTSVHVQIRDELTNAYGKLEKYAQRILRLRERNAALADTLKQTTQDLERLRITNGDVRRARDQFQKHLQVEERQHKIAIAQGIDARKRIGELETQLHTLRVACGLSASDDLARAKLRDPNSILRADKVALADTVNRLNALRRVNDALREMINAAIGDGGGILDNSPMARAGKALIAAYEEHERVTKQPSVLPDFLQDFTTPRRAPKKKAPKT